MDKGTILLIEDDPSIASCLSEFLRQFDYEVLISSNGPQGIDIFSKNERIILAIIDYNILGGMNGLKVYEELIKIRPVKALFTSGSDVEVFKSDQVNLHNVPFLQKPVSLKKLLDIIKSL